MRRSRNHIYNLFQSNKIATKTILEIGKIINHDFTTELFLLKQQQLKEEELNKNEILFWKEK